MTSEYLVTTSTDPEEIHGCAPGGRPSQLLPCPSCRGTGGYGQQTYVGPCGRCGGSGIEGHTPRSAMLFEHEVRGLR